MWSDMFMRITKPDSDQQLEGNRFRSNEEMTDYHIYSSAGFTPVNDKDEAAPAPAPVNTTPSASDSLTAAPSQRQSAATNKRKAHF